MRVKKLTLLSKLTSTRRGFGAGADQPEPGQCMPGFTETKRHSPATRVSVGGQSITPPGRSPHQGRGNWSKHPAWRDWPAENGLTCFKHPLSEPHLPMKNPNRARQPLPASAGFTLIELMVTLAVAAILLTVGVPNFREFIERNRISSTTNMLVGALQLARSEAIKRGNNPVILCKSNSAGTACNTSGDWKDGWLLYTDKNADKSFTSGTDELIRRYDAMPKLSITTGNSFQCWISFGANGYPEGGGTTCAGGLVGNGTFSICAASTSATQHGRSIVVNKIGRIRTQDKTCT